MVTQQLVSRATVLIKSVCRQTYIYLSEFRPYEMSQCILMEQERLGNYEAWSTILYGTWYMVYMVHRHDTWYMAWHMIHGTS